MLTLVSKGPQFISLAVLKDFVHLSHLSSLYGLSQDLDAPLNVPGLAERKTITSELAVASSLGILSADAFILLCFDICELSKLAGFVLSVWEPDPNSFMVLISPLGQATLISS